MQRLETFAASAATALALLATPLAAQELRFTVWTGNDAHLSMLNGIADSFTATRPGVTVNYETIPAGDYIQKLTFQLAGGNPPDLGWMFENSIPTFVAADAVLDLGPALNSAEGYDLADFSEPAMGLWADGDAVWGVPFSTSPFMIYFNKDMFDAAGLEDPLTLASKGEWDMDAFRAAAKALAEANDAYGFEFKDGQGYDSRIMHAIMPPIRAYGGYAWRDGECGFNKPEAVAALTQLHEMVFLDGSIVPPGEQGDAVVGLLAVGYGLPARVAQRLEGELLVGHLELLQSDDAVGLFGQPVQKVRQTHAQRVEVPGGELHRESGLRAQSPYCRPPGATEALRGERMVRKGAPAARDLASCVLPFVQQEATSCRARSVDRCCRCCWRACSAPAPACPHCGAMIRRV